jgi:hypothetical protein
MPYDKSDALLSMPNSIGKLISQGALPLALLVALTINRKLAIRPNVVLILLSFLALEAVVTLLGAQYPKGTLFRTFRFILFVATLWMLSPYWGRQRMIIVRYHVKILFCIICATAVGLAISPHKALNGGRLVNIIWPCPATQVAHYAAVAIGLVALLWLAGHMSGRLSTVIIVVSFVILLLTHTRTALAALIGGLLVGGLSMFGTSARVRKFFAWAAVVTGVVYVAGAAIITKWLTRGQSSQELTGLTGRTNFWGPLLAYPRDRFEMLFGFGLSNGSFRGLPIDSNWLDSYQDQGVFGITLCALILIFLVVAAFFQARGISRAIVLFLAVYCIVASFTEDGITNPSPYMMDVAVAASVLVSSVRARGSSLRVLLTLPGGPGMAGGFP